MSEEIKPAVTENQEELEICYCCGQKTMAKPDSVDPQDMRRYMACLITGESFKKTFQLYQGAIKVQLIMLTAGDNNRQQAAITKLCSKYPAITGLQRDMLQLALRRLAMINLLIIKGEHEDKTYNVHAYYKQIMDKLPLLEARQGQDMGIVAYDLMDDAKELSGIPRGILDELIITFCNLYQAMVHNGFDKNFWYSVRQIG